MALPLSVIVPAFNEADYILATLDCLRTAERHFRDAAGGEVEILVVDNASTDATRELARRAGARIVDEATHNVARVRNAGAAAARHPVLVFLDADTLVPPGLLLRIAQAMADESCAGGAVDALHRPARLVLRVYLKLWRILGLVGGMAQGACQFCRSDVFQELGGYDERQYMGEDVDFYWRLKRLARRRALSICYVRDLQVLPSPRRWDRWPVWRSLVWTCPPLVIALRRHKRGWAGWYGNPPR